MNKSSCVYLIFPKGKLP